jgi:hypothetical protein
MMGATKWQRESLPDIEDILRYARAMWRRRDPYKVIVISNRESRLH